MTRCECEHCAAVNRVLAADAAKITPLIANVVAAIRKAGFSGWATDQIWDKPTAEGVAVYQGWIVDYARRRGDNDGSGARAYMAMAELRFALLLGAS